MANNDWLDPRLFETGQFTVWDALGNELDGVESARETADGVEVICLAVTLEGDELVSTIDGGVTFDPVRARMEIPGGTLVDLREE